jgi:hypothetical protein
MLTYAVCVLAGGAEAVYVGTSALARAACVRTLMGRRQRSARGGCERESASERETGGGGGRGGGRESESCASHCLSLMQFIHFF